MKYEERPWAAGFRVVVPEGPQRRVGWDSRPRIVKVNERARANYVQ